MCRRTQKLLLIFFLIFLFLFACKKEKKSSIEITFISPVAGYTTSFNDTFHVAAIITSDVNIHSVAINVYDQNSISVSDPLILAVSGKEYHLSADYAAINSLLPSGDYILDISVVGDGLNIHKGVSIHLLGIPKAVQNIYAMTRTASNTLNIYSIKNDSVELIKTINSDYSGCAVSSIYRQFYLCGKTAGGINCFSTDDFSDVFNIPPPNPFPLQSLTSFTDVDEKIFISHLNGAIKAYDQSGHLQYDTGDDPYFTPLKTYKTEDYIITQLSSNLPGSDDQFIAAYFYPSGVRRQLVHIDFDAVGFDKKNSDIIRIFGTRNGYTMAYEYSISQNFITLMQNMGFYNTRDVIKEPDGKYILRTESGLVEYSADNFTALTASSVVYDDLVYDDVDNIYYAARPGHIYKLNTNLFTVSDTINLPVSDSILAVRILYNR